MRRLILFRHAKTEARSAEGDDLSRRLVERGRAECRRMGVALAEAGYEPDLALVSLATRARETWNGLAETFTEARVELRRGLYDAAPQEIAAEIADRTEGAGTVIVVGHNPGLQELAVELAFEGGAAAEEVERLSAGFPTSAAAVFRFDAASPARLETYLVARNFREDA
jgi:phosphohistidine phosphatase